MLLMRLKKNHLPIIKENKVFVDSVEHPMIDEHYIEQIEAEFEGKQVSKVFFKLRQKPEAEFPQGKKITKTRTYCNLHELLKN